MIGTQIRCALWEAMCTALQNAFIIGDTFPVKGYASAVLVVHNASVVLLQGLNDDEHFIIFLDSGEVIKCNEPVGCIDIAGFAACKNDCSVCMGVAKIRVGECRFLQSTLRIMPLFEFGLVERPVRVLVHKSVSPTVALITSHIGNEQPCGCLLVVAKVGEDWCIVGCFVATLVV